MNKPTKQTIDQYRQIIADVGLGYATYESIDNLRTIVAQYDENQRLRGALLKIASNDGDIRYSQDDSEFSLQNCIDLANEALNNE